MKMKEKEFEQKINKYFRNGYPVEVVTKDNRFFVTFCKYNDKEAMLFYGDQDNKRLLTILPYSAILEVRKGE